jgi:hypothetical protein
MTGPLKTTDAIIGGNGRHSIGGRKKTKKSGRPSKTRKKKRLKTKGETIRTKTPDLDFVSRASTEDGTLSIRKLWRSRCSKYRVAHESGFGFCACYLRRVRHNVPSLVHTGTDGVTEVDTWQIVSRHKTKRGAIAACQKHYLAEAS